MGVNKVILLGRLGKDPELRFTASQLPVTTFTLATGDRRKDASGNWTEHTEWHTIVAFGKTAELCSNYLKKGREVFIDGRIQTRKWQDKEGKDRYTTEIIANAVQFVGGKSAGAGSDSGMGDSGMGGSGMGSSPMAAVGNLSTADSIASGGGEVSFDDDDIPF
jgi:single-strand DNA-binding protein